MLCEVDLLGGTQPVLYAYAGLGLRHRRPRMFSVGEATVLVGVDGLRDDRSAFITDSPVTTQSNSLVS